MSNSIGNVGRLNVRKSRPVYDSPAFHRWTVGESPDRAQVLDLDGQQDHLYVGGVPEFFRTADLVSSPPHSFAGVLAGLRVNGREVGLWDFASSSGGCRETHVGAEDRGEVDQDCYTFNGDGYATQSDLSGYDARHLSLSLEFR